MSWKKHIKGTDPGKSPMFPAKTMKCPHCGKEIKVNE